MEYYILIGLIWGIYASIQQVTHYPESSRIKKWIAFGLNTLFWFIAIPIAIKNRDKFKARKEQ